MMDGGFDPWHALESLSGAGAAILIYMWTIRTTDKRDRERQHQENQKVLQQLREGQHEIENRMEILPLHGHTEPTGALHAEGIYRPRNNNH